MWMCVCVFAWNSRYDDETMYLKKKKKNQYVDVLLRNICLSKFLLYELIGGVNSARNNERKQKKKIIKMSCVEFVLGCVST